MQLLTRCMAKICSFATKLQVRTKSYTGSSEKTHHARARVAAYNQTVPPAHVHQWFRVQRLRRKISFGGADEHTKLNVPSFVFTQVLRHSLRADRRMIARGWARLAAAAAASASAVAITEGPKKIASLRAYAVDLQQQVGDSGTPSACAWGLSEGKGLGITLRTNYLPTKKNLPLTGKSSWTIN